MKHRLIAHHGTDEIRLGSNLSDLPSLTSAMQQRKCFTNDSGSTRIVLPNLLCINIDANQQVELLEASPPVSLFNPCGDEIDLNPKALAVAFPEMAIYECGYSICIHRLDICIGLTCPFNEATRADIDVVSIARKGYFEDME